jgi:hypothetical protein
MEKETNSYVMLNYVMLNIDSLFSELSDKQYLVSKDYNSILMSRIRYTSMYLELNEEDSRSSGILSEIENAIDLHPDSLFKPIINETFITREHYNEDGSLRYNLFFHIPLSKPTLELKYITTPASIIYLALERSTDSNSRIKNILIKIWNEMLKRQENTSFWTFFLRTIIKQSSASLILELSTQTKAPLNNELLKCMITYVVERGLGSINKVCNILDIIIDNATKADAIVFFTLGVPNVLKLLINNLSVVKSARLIETLYLIQSKVPELNQTISDSFCISRNELLVIDSVAFFKDENIKQWLLNIMDQKVKDNVSTCTLNIPYEAILKNMVMVHFFINRYLNGNPNRHMVELSLTSSNSLNDLFANSCEPFSYYLTRYSSLLDILPPNINDNLARAISIHALPFYEKMEPHLFVKELTNAKKGKTYFLNYLLNNTSIKENFLLENSLENVNGKNQLKLLLDITKSTPLQAMTLTKNEKIKKWCLLLVAE